MNTGIKHFDLARRNGAAGTRAVSKGGPGGLPLAHDLARKVCYPAFPQHIVMCCGNAGYKELEERPTIKKVVYEWMDERLDYREIQKGSFDRAVTDFKRFFESSGFALKYIDRVNADDLTAFVKASIRDYDLTAKAWANLKGIIFGIFAYAKEKKYTLFSISTFFGDLKLPRNMFRKVVVSDEEQVLTTKKSSASLNGSTLRKTACVP